MFVYGETVTRLRATLVVDPYSGEATEEDWSSPDEVDYIAGVGPGGSAEPLSADRRSVESDYDVFLPPGADVTARDRLRIRGRVCQVDGDPFDWLNPFTGWTPGTVARASVQEG